MEKPVIVVVGPTGSGKTGASILLAKKIGGEIISADSRAIYKGMDIGTAKPTLLEMDGVVHHGLDLVYPDEKFNVFDYKQYACSKIREIQKRGKIPIIVGGTGLYVDALVFDYQFNENVQKNCSDRKQMTEGFLMYGIKWRSEQLRGRLRYRIEKMYTEQLFLETRELVAKYSFDLQAMRSNIYQFVWRYLSGVISLEEAKEQSFLDDWHLARRQITWFKRNKAIKWFSLQNLEQGILKDLSEMKL